MDDYDDKMRDKLKKNVVIQENDCWVWQLSKNQKGYGSLSYRGVNRKAHRISYQLFVGEIPEGLTIDHLCRNRACINPAHMECVTRGENVLRGDTIASKNKKATHCFKGHALTEDNLSSCKNQRLCLICHRERSKIYRAMKKQGE